MTRMSMTSGAVTGRSMRAGVVRALLVVAGASIPLFAVAQYKSVGPDGRVTYSDQPPSPSARVLEDKKAAPTAPTSSLPYELQQATSRYPVVLYTANRCSPCDDARSYLRGRGVPFAEKTVSSDDDIALFKQQSADGTAPVLIVGSRKVIGFVQGNVSALLDDAGYPGSNKLPRDYQYPTPTSLAPAKRNDAPQAAAPSTPAPRSTTPVAPPPPPANAPGFRF